MQSIQDSQNSLIPASMAEYVLTKAKSLSMLPTIALQALEVAKNPECSIAEFSKLVERDSILANAMLARVNSAIYSPTTPVVDLKRAILRLGLGQCRNLIYSLSLSSMMRRVGIEEGGVRESLCRHGFMTGLMSQKLNDALKLGFEGEEYSAGLMHDFGRILLAISFPDEFSQFEEMRLDESAPHFLDEELSVIGVNHCQLGAWFAELNGLPGTLVDTIRYHHAPEQAKANRQLTALTAVSDHMINHIHRHGSASDYNIHDNQACAVLEECGVTLASTRLSEIVVPLMENVGTEANQLINE